MLPLYPPIKPIGPLQITTLLKLGLLISPARPALGCAFGWTENFEECFRNADKAWILRNLIISNSRPLRIHTGSPRSRRGDILEFLNDIVVVVNLLRPPMTAEGRFHRMWESSVLTSDLNICLMRPTRLLSTGQIINGDVLLGLVNMCRPPQA